MKTKSKQTSGRGRGRPEGSVATQLVSMRELNRMFKEDAEIPVGSKFLSLFKSIQATPVTSDIETVKAIANTATPLEVKEIPLV